MYDAVTNEREITAAWEQSQAFRVSNDRRRTDCIFYDGPPFATGLPHYGTLLVSTIKDTVARYKNMCGYRVPRRWGWDCHGVPVESLIQKKLGMSRVDVIKNGAISTFNNECRQSVDLCADQWRETVSRMGRWVDFDAPYRTMDRDYMESVWWCFKQLYEQGRVYRAKRVMPYSAALQTTLSNSEISDSYRTVDDPYVIAKFQAVGKDYCFLAYTTTPWTLPSNAGLCLNPEHEYSIVQLDSGEQYLVAAALLSKVFKDHYEILETNPGKHYVGQKYHSLFDDSIELPVVTDNYVTVEDGTGVVHLAPAFGEDDYRVGTQYGLRMLDTLDLEGKFTSGDYAGLFCKDADKKIIKDLRAQNKVFKSGTLTHDYPFCDRTNTPLIYRAVDAWYIRVEDIRDRMVKHNATIHWVPESVGAGRFDNWLKNAKDWNVSRSRLWGCCIPIWVSLDGDAICVGSVEELEALAKVKLGDLHKDNLDQVTFEKDGKLFTRVPEVLDCWFESGCMPYAQYHYPFENKELVEQNLPADFVVEGLDQTRGWFYSLMVLSTLLFDKPPFKHVIVNGMVLAEDGSKMSKSKKNYVDPTVLLDKYGADTLRAYLTSSALMYAEPVAFSEKDLQTVNKTLLSPLLNAMNFYSLYSEIDNWKGGTEAKVVRELDIWILAELQVLVNDTSQFMESYTFYKVLPKVSGFLDKLCNWYIRLSRDIFWEEGLSDSKQSAYYTLHHVLLTLAKLMAPFVPFLTEYIYNTLGHIGSVHWENYPTVAEVSPDALVLIARMQTLRTLATLGHNLRVKSGIKVRQPLPKLTVCGAKDLSGYDQALLCDELNVKSIELSDSQEIRFAAKANFRTLSKKYGKEVQKIARAIAALSSEQVAELQNHALTVEGFEVVAEDVFISQTLVTSMPTDRAEGFTIILDTTLSPQLIDEGDVREVVSFLQKLRKSNKFKVTDQIKIIYAGDEAVQKLLLKYQDEIKKQVLATEIVLDTSVTQNPLAISTGGCTFVVTLG